ncbi:winged helix DNA-binding domain-containing protein [Streptomyces sp. UNOB3_S3]|uniref:winged helix DNA-binding domain-containing protein n=1 Tax=Streptomyces sp. UNOB3_S3 TaxID=2871682 RepID=UPI001E4D5CC5|nr:winged helix DNA-binding domain-containing protein [Streptomyces sp. UNOB3_S3]MCC3776669.1 winged helix DNA-binding domain-containing protein [Streptomyces sp. UNOB3_S3]
MSNSALPRISDDARRARLGSRHLLAPAHRAAAVEDVADALVGLHATDAATVYLSACARLAEPDPAEVERGLYDDVTLVKLWSMRSTIFAVSIDTAPCVENSTARPVARRARAGLLKVLGEAWGERRLAETERAVLAALTARGEATTAELAEDVPALKEKITMSPGKPYESQQSVGSRVLRLLASDGHVRRSRPRGSWTSSLYAWAPSPRIPDMPEREARAELVRRWLASYGPSTEADLKWWTGWSLRDTRAALADTGAVGVRLDHGTGVALPDDLGPVEDAGDWAALLPGLDPTAMGWRERDWYLDPEHVPFLFDHAGNIGPTVWWNGRIIGGWAQRADGEVVWRALVDAGRDAAAAVEAEAGRLAAWLGDVRVTPRFRTPLERELVR